MQARKVPLKQLSQRLLDKHLKYMRLTPTTEIKAMTTAQLSRRLSRLTHIKPDSLSHEELCKTLLHSERTRSLCLWHDHATILKMGFIMVTVHVMYDPAVFYTNEEYSLRNKGSSITSVQSEVEQPQIYLLSAGSSSVEDQAALIGDRLNDLLDLSIPAKTQEGIEIYDTIRFFTGDHPAVQFEQGSKQGGTYKCGACGCRENNYVRRPSTCSSIPVEVSSGSAKFGYYWQIRKATRNTYPFSNLKVNELKAELTARGIHINSSMHKNDLQAILDRTLRGVTRVPALLLPNPTKSLTSLNLERYEILASEPLHDIKGHILNLITELPYILPTGEVSTKCTHLIKCCLAKEKKSVADLRRIIILIYLC